MRRKYIIHGQMSIFDLPPDLSFRRAPRYSFDNYGITKKRYRQLTEYVRSGIYYDIAMQSARTAGGMIADQILSSIAENKSYDSIEYSDGLHRISCGRTDFYGYRRYFYYIFDGKVKEIENGNKEHIAH